MKGKGVNNPDIDFIDERSLRLEERKLRVDRERLLLNREKDELVPIAHIEAALGAMLSHFRAQLDALEVRIAQGIDEADKDELLALLKRAEKEKLTFRQLTGMVKRGKIRAFADFHARRAFIGTEIDALQRTLASCEYLESDAQADEEE